MSDLGVNSGDIEVHMPTTDAKDIPTYWVLAVIALFVNPLLGLFALIFAYEVTRCRRFGWPHARRYSDLAFGFSMTAYVSTILIIVFVYATDGFPRNAYFCRQDVIDGVEVREYCTD